jgi:hypothetical protein
VQVKLESPLAVRDVQASIAVLGEKDSDGLAAIIRRVVCHPNSGWMTKPYTVWNRLESAVARSDTTDSNETRAVDRPACFRSVEVRWFDSRCSMRYSSMHCGMSLAEANPNLLAMSKAQDAA